jgi:hypothetical protein
VYLKSNILALRKLSTIRKILSEIIQDPNLDLELEEKLNHILKVVDEVYDIISHYQS